MFLSLVWLTNLFIFNSFGMGDPSSKEKCQNADEVDYHHEYLDYELQKVQMALADLEKQRAGISAFRHPIRANNLDNSIRALTDKKLSLQAKKNVDAQICVVLPSLDAVPYNDEVPELHWIAYEIARSTKIREDLIKEKDDRKTGFLKRNKLAGKITDYEDNIQILKNELNALIKQLNVAEVLRMTG